MFILYTIIRTEHALAHSQERRLPSPESLVSYGILF